MPYCVCSYGYLVIVALWIQYCGIPVGLSFYYMQFNWDDWFLCKFFVFVSHFSSTDTTELADNTATAVDGIIATLFFIVKNGQSSFEDEYKMVKLHSGQATEYIYFWTSLFLLHVSMKVNIVLSSWSHVEITVHSRATGYVHSSRCEISFQKHKIGSFYISRNEFGGYKVYIQYKYPIKFRFYVNLLICIKVKRKKTNRFLM